MCFNSNFKLILNSQNPFLQSSVYIDAYSEKQLSVVGQVRAQSPAALSPPP